MADRSSAATPTLREAVEHVVNDSPGTPESVKQYLSRALAASPDREPVRAREAELVRALEWYAERRNYVPAGPPAASPPKHLMERDAWDGNGPGARARAALASARGETDESSAATPECRAPHCWHEYGTPCGTCPAASPDREPVSAHLNAIRAWAKDPMVWARIGPAGVGRVLDTVDELEAALASARGETEPGGASGNDGTEGVASPDGCAERQSRPGVPGSVSPLASARGETTHGD